MRYSDTEAMIEIERRAQDMRRRRKGRSITVLRVSCTLIVVLLVAEVIAVSGTRNASLQSPGAGFATLLLTGSVGGYILAGVIAFMIGVAITLACLRYRANRSQGRGDKGDVGQKRDADSDDDQEGMDD